MGGHRRDAVSFRCHSSVGEPRFLHDVVCTGATVAPFPKFFGVPGFCCHIQLCGHRLGGVFGRWLGSPAPVSIAFRFSFCPPVSSKLLPSNPGLSLALSPTARVAGCSSRWETGGRGNVGIDDISRLSVGGHLPFNCRVRDPCRLGPCSLSDGHVSRGLVVAQGHFHHPRLLGVYVVCFRDRRWSIDESPQPLFPSGSQRICRVDPSRAARYSDND